MAEDTPAITFDELEGELHRANLRIRELEGFGRDKDSITARLRGDIATLGQTIAKLTRDVATAKAATDSKDVSLRRANRMLAERIQDVDDLTERNREFWKAIDAMQPSPVAIYEAWNRSALKKPFLVGFGA